MIVAERIREKIASTPAHPIPMAASFGVPCFPAGDIDNLNDLLKAADRARCVARGSGRNRVCVDTSAT